MIKELAKKAHLRLLSYKENNEDSLHLQFFGTWKNPKGKKVELNVYADIQAKQALIVLAPNTFTEKERISNTQFVQEISTFLSFRYRLTDIKIIGPTIKDKETYTMLLNRNFDNSFEINLKTLFLHVQKAKYNKIDEHNFPQTKDDEYFENYYLRGYIWGAEGKRMLKKLENLGLLHFFENKRGEFEYTFCFQKNKRDTLACYRIITDELKEMGYDARYGFVLSCVYKTEFM
mgnify:CR=1 FL=1